MEEFINIIIVFIVSIFVKSIIVNSLCIFYISYNKAASNFFNKNLTFTIKVIIIIRLYVVDAIETQLT